MKSLISLKSHFHSFQERKIKYLCFPYALFLLLFVIIPIILIVGYAFTDSNGSFSFNALVEFFTSTSKISVLIVSLFMGLQTTLICLVLAFPAAYFLANKKFNKNAEPDILNISDSAIKSKSKIYVCDNRNFLKSPKSLVIGTLCFLPAINVVNFSGIAIFCPNIRSIVSRNLAG